MWQRMFSVTVMRIAWRRELDCRIERFSSQLNTKLYPSFGFNLIPG